MPRYLIAGDPSALRHVSTDRSLSALMCRGEVATFHQVTQSVAFHRVAVILEISSRTEQNAVPCPAVNPHLLIFVVFVHFFFFFNLVLAKAAGTFCLSC